MVCLTGAIKPRGEFRLRISGLEGEGIAMIQPESLGKLEEVSTPPPCESATGSPALGRKVSRRALWLLGVLLAMLAISTGFRYIPAPAPESTVASLSAVTFPPPEDREAVRANWTHAVPVSAFRFTEIAQQAGIDFVHVSGMTEAKHFPTAYGSGVAMFDYDNDGKLDLYFATMTFLPLGKASAAPTGSTGISVAIGSRTPPRRPDWVIRVSATESSSATSTTTATRTSSSATTARTSCTSITAMGLSPTSADTAGIDRPGLVLRRSVPRLRQRWRP